MPVILSGALPLTYPAALGLRPSDRPPPFALWRSGMLLPAAGAAVAAGPASTGSVARQPHHTLTPIPFTPIELRHSWPFMH